MNLPLIIIFFCLALVRILKKWWTLPLAFLPFCYECWIIVCW